VAGGALICDRSYPLPGQIALNAVAAGGAAGHAAYGRSKLANLHFTYELQRRFAAADANDTATAAHPGGSNTNLAGHMEDRLLFRLADS